MRSVSLSLLIAALLIGCQSQQNTAADGPTMSQAPTPEPQANAQDAKGQGSDAKSEDQSDGPFAALAPWNWFGGGKKKTSKPDAASDADTASAKQQQSKGQGLAALAPWNWFGGEKKKPTNPDAVPRPRSQEAKGDGLAALAPWNWFKEDEEEPLTTDEVLGNLSPGRANLKETPGEARATAARTLDTNLSSMRQDIRRFLLLDRPSRAVPEPVP